MALQERPWNWCHKCKQPVSGEFFDGSMERCLGCDRLFVATSYTDGRWTLTVVREHDREYARRRKGAKP